MVSQVTAPQVTVPKVTVPKVMDTETGKVSIHSTVKYTMLENSTSLTKYCL